MKLEGQVRIPSGCAISAVISREGKRMTGEAVINSMVPMHDRSNGLGGGFAAYGIYPEYRDFYAFHIFFEDNTTRRECETLLKEGFEIVQAEVIPIRIIPEITDVPLIWRYFVSPLKSVLSRLQLDEKEFVARLAPYGISQSEFIRRAIRGATIRPVVTVSPVNDELLSAIGKLTAEYGRIGNNLNQIARTLNEWHSPYPQLAGEVRTAASDLAALKFEVLEKVGEAVGNVQTYQL